MIEAQLKQLLLTCGLCCGSACVCAYVCLWIEIGSVCVSGVCLWICPDPFSDPEIGSGSDACPCRDHDHVFCPPRRADQILTFLPS